MRDAQPTAIYLKDYQQPDYWIERTELTFELQDEYTLVTALLDLVRNDQAADGADLLLAGQDLELISLVLDGQTLTTEQYELGDESLTVKGVQQRSQLVIKTRIYPAKNTALEGLYRSGGMYCTQCEAEGFRRITYYLDRPDVMSVFTTHIIADAAQFPVLLSNGNLIADRVENGLHKVTWQDPHKKPAYLFALVAGDLRVKEDRFTTMSGRDVALKFLLSHRISIKPIMPSMR